MSRHRVKEWWMRHVPPWAWPFNPWGAKGRPDLPERHQAVNELTELQLRVDRLDRLHGQARLEEWREQQRD
jgi:hypothetical protein